MSTSRVRIRSSNEHSARRAIASKVVLSVGTLPVAALLAAACGDDPPRAVFTEPDGTAQVNLPSSGDASISPEDAGAEPDARGPFDPTDEPITCTNTPCATQLVAGSDHFCARMSDGTVRCWGDDAFGALGRGDAPMAPGGDASAPAAVVGLDAVTQISAAGSTTCARTEDGGVLCWGDNRRAVLGLAVGRPVADQAPHPTPMPVALDAPASRVDVGPATACALLESRKLACWGRDDQEQLARDESRTGLDSWNPVRGPGIAALDPLEVTRTTAGSFTAFGLDATGDLWNWGGLAAEAGVLAGRVSSISPDRTPRRVALLSKVTSFAATASVDPPWNPVWEPGEPMPERPKQRAHACAISNGEVYCWGRSYTSALCTGLPDSEVRPRLAPFTAKTWPQQIATGDEITCVRATDGSIHCCGSDDRGRLGTGSVGVLSKVFTKASAFTGHAVQVAASSRAVCALVQGGTVECWGSNEKGELGTKPDVSPHPAPSPILL
ncbi:MAG: hypothetical protein BGO98_18085 [Myxococcales bacterium 68-20]|nr:hypothetical protein [Myxococcales bacterium]OJY23849.1 MAG: hypothetical protein BGO98_18085 [Myxococcales bacterium 68-20]